MKDSGTTRPCLRFCSVSSPICAAALSPSSTSPGCRRVLHLVVEVRPHAGQAVGLQLHAHLQLRWPSRSSPARLLQLGLHLVGDAEQLLHVMADLVRDHVGLGEVAGRLKRCFSSW